MLDRAQLPEAGVLEDLPIFPLPNVVLLPGMMLPLNVFEPRYLALVAHAQESGGLIGVPLLRERERLDGTPPRIESVFGVGRLLDHHQIHPGRRLIRLEGIGRVRCVEELERDEFPFRRCRVEALPEAEPADVQSYAILCAQIERLARTLSEADRMLVESWLSVCDRRVVLYGLSSVIPNVEALRQIQLGCPSSTMTCDLRFQQACIDEHCPDKRLAMLLDRASALVDQVGASGEFPMTVLN